MYRVYQHPWQLRSEWQTRKYALRAAETQFKANPDEIYHVENPDGSVLKIFARNDLTD